LADNAAALAILVAPLVAVLGIFATWYVIRARYKARTSLYTAMRQTHVHEIEKIRNQIQADERKREQVPTRFRPAVAAAAGGAGTATGAAEVKERLSQVIVGNLSLAAALLMVLMGVLLAVSQSR
jgi:hypothetical protein